MNGNRIGRLSVSLERQRRRPAARTTGESADAGRESGGVRIVQIMSWRERIEYYRRLRAARREHKVALAEAEVQLARLQIAKLEYDPAETLRELAADSQRLKTGLAELDALRVQMREEVAEMRKTQAEMRKTQDELAELRRGQAPPS